MAEKSLTESEKRVGGEISKKWERCEVHTEMTRLEKGKRWKDKEKRWEETQRFCELAEYV